MTEEFSIGNDIQVEALYNAIQIIQENKRAWVSTPISERIALIEATILSFETIADKWVQASWEAKGLDKDHFAVAEEWALVAIVFRLLHALKTSLSEIQTDGRPQIPGKVYTRSDNRVVAEVFPKSTKDKLLYTSLKGEAWFNEGISKDEILNKMANEYHQVNTEGTVTLVLGAGNASSLVVTDFLYKLFGEQHVVILKMNPVNDYLGQWVEQGFAPLINKGILQVVYGGREAGEYLAHHDLIDELHVTGSAATYEAVVFGTGDDGKQHKNEQHPILNKRFTAELGNISPVIIVPGAWQQQDITTQARTLATRLISNAGFNCLTPRLVIQHESWQYRDLFNQAVNDALARIPTREAYYPNAEKRHANFIEAHPDAHQHGEKSQGHLPWTYITDVDPTNTDNIAFTTEAFCGLCCETALSAPSIPEFIAQAVDFVNAYVWGTLVATIIVHPDSMKDLEIAAAVEQAIADLRYGTVGVNVYGETGYLTAITPWGGHAGQDIYNIQSGIGFVNNTLMFDEKQIQKSVLRQNFNAPSNTLDPIDKSLTHAMEAIARFEARPNMTRGFNLIRSLFGS